MTTDITAGGRAVDLGGPSVDQGGPKFKIELGTIISLPKKRTGFLKVITSADDQIFAQNQVKSKKSLSRPQFELCVSMF